MRVGFEEREDRIMSDKNIMNSSPFIGCTIAATASKSVTRKTNYLICRAKPGSKLVKARELGIPVLMEQEFLKMVSA